MTYDNTNKGALFKNDRREKDTQPEYTGKINVDGTEYWLSAWVKDGKKGKFFSLSVKKKDFSPAREAVQSAPIQEDEIPF